VASRLPTGKVITDDGPIQNIADGRYRLNCTAHIPFNLSESGD
jgi:hypothetical protein